MNTATDPYHVEQFISPANQPAVPPDDRERIETLERAVASLNVQLLELRMSLGASLFKPKLSSHGG